VVLLVGPQDEEFAARLIRDGAQDFLVKGAVDCAPLAHAIRNAVERHRLLMAARSAAYHDSLTGLPNRAGFLLAAERDRKLAQRLARRWMVMVAEPRHLAELESVYGEQRRDLALVEAADHLRSIASPIDLVGRISETRFGLAIFDTEIESVEEAWARIHGTAAEHRLSIGAAVCDPALPVSLEILLEQAGLDLAPITLAMRR
jgi:diguanylate cyclase (GGDEF)-like protein